MRRNSRDAALARARTVLRLGGTGPEGRGPRTAARRAAGRRLPDGLSSALLLAAAEAERRDRVAARAAACAHASRVAAVIGAADRAALAAALGEDARRFAVARRSAVAGLAPLTAPATPTMALIEDWVRSRERIGAALAIRAEGQPPGEPTTWAGAGLSALEAEATEVALAAEGEPA